MKFRRLGAAAVVMGLLAGSVGGAVAQDAGGPTAYEDWNTKEVAPGVLRILDDGAGHELAGKTPRGQGRLNHIAVGPDGDVWLSVTVEVTRDDGKRRGESRLWPLGREKTYGRIDGLGQHHHALLFDDEGRLWVHGNRIATLDDGEWTSTNASNSVVAPDGSVWIGGGMGVEQWNGTELVPHLDGIWTGGVFVGPDDTVGVEAWDGTRLFDGTDWQTISRRGSDRAMTEDGVLAVKGNQGKGLHLYRDGQEVALLDRMRVHSLSAAPDGSIWIVGGVPRNRAAAYRIDPSEVFAAQEVGATST